MNAADVSGDDLRELVGSLKDEPVRRAPSQLEIACGGQLMLVQTPAKIYLKDLDNALICDDLQSWGYTPVGILTVGYFDGETPDDERARVWPIDRVECIEFNRDRYEEILEEIQKEEEENASTESGDDGGTESGVDEAWAKDATPAA